MIDTKFNPRTYRRNRSKLIIVWDAIGVETDKNIEVVDDSIGEHLFFNSFIPARPERFSNNIRGVVIDQEDNGLDAADEITVRITIKDISQTFTKSIKVLPYKAFKEKPQRVILCAWSNEKQSYVPLNVKTVGNENLLLVDVKNN